MRVWQCMNRPCVYAYLIHCEIILLNYITLIWVNNFIYLWNVIQNMHKVYLSFKYCNVIILAFFRRIWRSTQLIVWTSRKYCGWRKTMITWSVNTLRLWGQALLNLCAPKQREYWPLIHELLCGASLFW